MFRLSIASLAVFAVVVLSTAHAQTEPSSQAAALMNSGDHAGALAEAEKALASTPGDLTLLKIKAVSQMETGDPQAAARTLRGALAGQPDSVSCRYYLAQALAYCGELGNALALCREVIASAAESEYAKMAAAIVPELERLLQQKQAEGALAAAATTDTVQPSGKRWDVIFRSALEYDDNVPARASDGHNHVHGPQESFRNLISLGLEYRPVEQTLDASPLTVGLGTAAYQSWHWREALSAFDLTSLNGNLHLARAGVLPKVKWPYRFKVAGVYQHNWLDGEFYNNETSVGASLDVQTCESALTVLSYMHGWREFGQDSVFPRFFSRDGTVQTLGVAQYVYLFDNRLVLGADYAYVDTHSEGTQFDSQAHGAGLSAQVALPWRMALNARAGYQTEDYTEFTPEPQRLDDVWTFSVSLSRPVWGDWLVAEMTCIHTGADSNQDFAGYERNVFGVALSASF